MTVPEKETTNNEGPVVSRRRTSISALPFRITGCRRSVFVIVVVVVFFLVFRNVELAPVSVPKSTTLSKGSGKNDASSEDKEYNTRTETRKETENDLDRPFTTTILPPACQGRDHLVRILVAAGVNVSDVECEMLPTWREVTDLYGDKPIVNGLGKCRTYRALLSADARKPLVRVAGPNNAGTTALARELISNFNFSGGLVDMNVPWGKHTLATHKWERTFPKTNTESKAHVLGVVLVRDPFRWMSSMCKAPYTVEWERIKGYCPNLVDSVRNETFRVTFSPHHSGKADQFNSLADMWSEWYRAYMDADYPRLLIRFEDMLFHAEEVMKLVGECAGLNMTEHAYQYVTEASKPHGSSSDLFGAIVKYGSARGRFPCFTKVDVDYVRSALDGLLMETFHYPQIPANYTPDPSVPCYVESKRRTGGRRRKQKKQLGT